LFTITSGAEEKRWDAKKTARDYYFGAGRNADEKKTARVVDY
jgi:hypothetical protein